MMGYGQCLGVRAGGMGHGKGGGQCLGVWAVRAA